MRFNQDLDSLRGRFEAVREHFTAEQQIMHGGGTRPRSAHYTLTPCGWWVYQGPRLVTLTVHDPSGRAREYGQVEHSQLLEQIQQRMTALAALIESGERFGLDMSAYWSEITTLDCAFELIVSDLHTGWSLASGGATGPLVDHALSASDPELEPGSHVTAEWEPF